MSRDWIHGEKRITWNWIIRDFSFRIVLYILIPILAMKFLGFTLKDFGLNQPTNLQWLMTIVLAVITFIACLFFRDTSKKPHHRKPIRDFWFSMYLVLINSPTEEFFYRGFLLVFFDRFFGNPLIGVAVSSFLFGIQHTIFFGASFRTVLFDTFGGFILAFAYIFLGRCLILVIVIHAVSNLALFTIGKYILNKPQRSRE